VIKLVNFCFSVCGKIFGYLLRFKWVLSLYNHTYERLPYLLLKLCVKYIPLPKEDFIWTIFLVNGKKVKTCVRKNDVKTLQFALSYQWHSPAINEIEWQICKNQPDGTPWIDIGANLGLRSLVALSEGRPVYFFEPNDDLNEVNKERCKLNEFVNYTFYDIGLSSKEGRASFYIDDSSYSSSLIKSHVAQKKLDRKVIIKTDTLDAVFEKEIHKFNTAFVKIDVEGHEYAVLQGATKFIKKVEPTLLIEISEKGENFDNIYKMMRENGYEIFQVRYLRNGKFLKIINQDISVSNNFIQAKDFLFIKDTKIEKKLTKFIYT